MKKFISKSAQVLTINYETTVNQNTAAEGEPVNMESVKISKTVCLSQGLTAELPEDHPHVMGLIEKGHLEEVIEEKKSSKK
jgi:hypothetical protein